MDTTKEFVIRRLFLLPLGILVLLLFALLAVTLMKGGEVGKAVILGCLILPVVLLFVESFFRKAEVGPEGVTVRKLLRTRHIPFGELTALDLVQVRKRAFLTLSTEEHFMILSNAYGGFPDLVMAVIDRAPAEVVTEELRQTGAKVPMKSSDIVSCWLAVALVAFILFLQVGPRG